MYRYQLLEIYSCKTKSVNVSSATVHVSVSGLTAVNHLLL